MQHYSIGRTANLFVIGPFLQFRYIKLLLLLHQPYICKCHTYHFISRKKKIVKIVKKSPFTCTSNQRTRFYTTKKTPCYIYYFTPKHTTKKTSVLCFDLNYSYSTINHVSLKNQNWVENIVLSVKFPTKKPFYSVKLTKMAWKLSPFFRKYKFNKKYCLVIHAIRQEKYKMFHPENFKKNAQKWPSCVTGSLLTHARACLHASRSLAATAYYCNGAGTACIHSPGSWKLNKSLLAERARSWRRARACAKSNFCHMTLVRHHLQLL